MSTDQEIERKFLVSVMPDLSRAHKSLLRQGYVTAPDDSVELRLRQSDESYVLSVKTGEGVVRTEREITLEPQQFEELWPETQGRRIEKTRWTGHLSDRLRYELDIYAGDLAPLLTVEVEFATLQDAAAFVAPDWFGRDVSDDKRFRNKSLALSGAGVVRELFG
ncbi:MAG: CYTH domain-containing protein [Paracoccus sp. (in: a-proteobacteria)]|uniref:CYTH domain-containing protein n=1 Tax=Paracoccus sp. TaxID=267 RepID=UPI0039196BF7